LVNGFIFGSFVYHDYYWYPRQGWTRVEKWLNETEWGELFLKYGNPFEKKSRIKSLFPGLGR
jgi:hypothetical protein